ncbi:MAG TPA: ATP-binding cassette domain-containing protein, partial [Polyangiaceae bacterium]|nr:ATP-binding cassette domain-containing protein [Polyangiaceae bacterium]
TTDNAIVLDYTQVAAHHAQLIQLDQQIFVEDLGSEPGTFVRGTRIRPGQRAQVNHGERIYFGPIPTLLQVQEETVSLIVEDQKGWAGRPLFDVAAAGISVDVPDRNDPGKRKQLLRDVHFKAHPGDFIALMGPSGSGKTTLLHVLTGYMRPSSGEVMINGSPLPAVFDSLRGSIGYVPQDDIIHAELTVYEAVRYSARFRLPHDYSDEEIDRRVQLTLAQLGLEAVASLQIGKPEQKVISGGQRKRVNIAMELVTDPVLIFLDEPTSGLAADDATALIDLLATLCHEHGKTIIATVHQPARDEYERFNLTLVLGHGGIPLYFGPTTDAYRFFEEWRGPLHAANVDNPRDMFAELKEREARVEKEMPGRTRQDIREAVSAAFAQEYLASGTFQDMISAGRSVDRVSALLGKLPARASRHGQLSLLIQRYLKVKLRDRVGTAILLLQAPLIGVLLSSVFWGQKPAVVYWCLGALNELSQASHQVSEASANLLSQLKKTQDNAGAVFFLVIAAVWFGTSNAAREIVSERAILRRERMVHLQLGRYVLSKFVVLGALSSLQCAVLLGIVFVCLQFSGGAQALLIALGMMLLTAWCSVALG